MRLSPISAWEGKKKPHHLLASKGIPNPMITLANSSEGKFTHPEVRICPNIHTAISTQDNARDKEHSLRQGHFMVVLEGDAPS